MSEVDNQLRFKRLDPKQTIPIYDKTVEENLLAVIRYFDDYDYVADEEVSMLEVITATDVSMFKKGSGGGSYEPVSSYPHYFNMVPVAIYENNEDETGDFEKVIPLIDAYDKMESDTLNDFEYFTDAYLALYGFTAEPEDITQMKQNRVILMDEGTSAEWLIKNSNDTSTENTKNRLDNNIHKFSKCPNMNDKEFAGNASGIAIKYKMLGTENLVSIKERKFKKGLQQRLELIAQITSLLGASFDWRSIDIVFTRNIPTNDLELAQMVNYLKDIVSDETLLAQIPFVEDVQNEIEKVKEEREQNKETSPFFNAAPDYKTKAMKEEETEEVKE